jgi:hypothetical protein
MKAPRQNRINGQWSPRPIKMLESPAYRALSLSAHRIMSRIEIEFARHSGKDNGRLPVTKRDFIAYGMQHVAVAKGIREAEALGFIQVTEHGRGGNSKHHSPNLFRLTFVQCRNSGPPTHEWRKIKTIEEAVAVAQAARAAKNKVAVAVGKRAARANKTRVRKPDPAPGTKTGPGSPHFPGTKTVPRGSKSPGTKSVPTIYTAIHLNGCLSCAPYSQTR